MDTIAFMENAIPDESRDMDVIGYMVFLIGTRAKHSDGLRVRRDLWPKGLANAPWAERWIKLQEQLGLDVQLQGTLLPIRNQWDAWTQCSMTSTQATSVISLLICSTSSSAVRPCIWRHVRLHCCICPTIEGMALISRCVD
eukprot:6466375-Amphidinium_carterae.4